MSDTVTVKHDGESYEVPTTFQRSDLAAYYGGVPESIEVERVYWYDGHVRAEGRVDGVVYEVGYFPEGGRIGTTDSGWVADSLDGVDPDELDTEPPGPTLWERDSGEEGGQ